MGEQVRRGRVTEEERAIEMGGGGGLNRQVNQSDVRGGAHILGRDGKDDKEDRGKARIQTCRSTGKVRGKGRGTAV